MNLTVSVWSKSKVFWSKSKVCWTNEDVPRTPDVPRVSSSSAACWPLYETPTGARSRSLGPFEKNGLQPGRSRWSKKPAGAPAHPSVLHDQLWAAARGSDGRGWPGSPQGEPDRAEVMWKQSTPKNGTQVLLPKGTPQVSFEGFECPPALFMSLFISWSYKLLTRGQIELRIDIERTGQQPYRQATEKPVDGNKPLLRLGIAGCEVHASPQEGDADLGFNWMIKAKLQPPNSNSSLSTLTHL